MRWFGKVALAALVLGFGSAAHAHLLAKNNATMRIKETSAYFVVSIPVSAFEGVDQDGDGRLDSRELGAGNAALQRQFAQGFSVSDGDNPATPVLTMVAAPHDEPGHGATDYVVVMHRVNFAAPPEHPQVRLTLFGSGGGEDAVSLRATRGERVEVAQFSAGAPEHRFF